MSPSQQAAAEHAGSVGLKPDRAAEAGADTPAPGTGPNGSAPAGEETWRADPAPGSAAPGSAAPGSAEPAADPEPGAAGQRSASDDHGSGPGNRPPGLSDRLMALARMIQIGAARGGRDGFGKKTLADAEDMLARAGDRMRLSADHTVIALAGGTGSGKSSLFNRLAGAEFSTVGVTRPVTRDAHACIWGAVGSGALLDWLGVPARFRYARASALDRGETDLSGLVLLDLPDHDSVMSHATDLVDRLVSQADVLIWVLDPQKYADAAVHRRFLVPMASHQDVLAVVLNQSDLLDSSQLDDCVNDLRRLLDAENLQEVPILVTSAVSGAGLPELRALLVNAVAAGRSAAARISADVDGAVARFRQYGGGDPSGGLPAAGRDAVVEKFVSAAGVRAIGDSLGSARELRAADYVGWPVAWLAQRLTGRDPLRKQRVGLLWGELRQVTAGPSGAQQAEIDNALTSLADQVAGPLPSPWSRTVRAALRSQSDAIPSAVGQAMGAELPAEDAVPWWWRLAGMWQGLLLGVAGVAVAWAALIAAFGELRVSANPPGLFTVTAALPWIGAAAVAALALGAGSAAACMALVRRSAAREHERVALRMRERIASIASELAFAPAEQELAEFARFRDELGLAGRAEAAEVSHS
ncbi:MAG: GTPase [Streptosporangiaceae bacterium]